MFTFVSELLHPDGEIPLFSDSGFGEAPSMKQITALSTEAGLAVSGHDLGTKQIGDYWIYRGTKTTAVFDCGQVSCSWLPAHAHCDLLGFEMSWLGQRWIVDSGNYNYEDDAMRLYCRSSLAHNVVTVGGQNHCDVWSKFRMGRRGKTLRFSPGSRQKRRLGDRSP